MLECERCTFASPAVSRVNYGSYWGDENCRIFGLGFHPGFVPKQFNIQGGNGTTAAKSKSEGDSLFTGTEQTLNLKL
jgi:hypothetical protein